MNGVIPGPLFLAIASTTTNASLENGTSIEEATSDASPGERVDRDNESMNGRPKTGVDGDSIPSRERA